MRSRISRAARSVNVIATSFESSAASGPGSRCERKRRVRTNVFPQPAPAASAIEDSRNSIAARCCGVRGEVSVLMSVRRKESKRRRATPGKRKSKRSHASEGGVKSNLPAFVEGLFERTNLIDPAGGLVVAVSRTCLLLVIDGECATANRRRQPRDKLFETLTRRVP